MVRDIVVMASESSSTVASPRRTLSVSRERASVFILGEGEGDRSKQGAKPAEVYGFVGSISTIVGAVLFFGWAYLPEYWLYSMGITYYPSRYWAVALPAYAMMLIVFICVAYTSLNYIVTIPPDSWNSLCEVDALRHSRSYFEVKMFVPVLVASWVITASACMSQLYFTHDNFTRDPVTFPANDTSQKERPIDPISDIPITEVNRMMFGSH